MKKNYYQIGDDFRLTQKVAMVKKKKNYPSSKVLIHDIGFYLIIPLLIAIPIGLYLDRKFQTRNIFTLGLIFLGFISSIYNLIRLVKKI